MSGRIRSIKPEWLDDELLVSASSEARVLSIGLLLLADDYGNGRGGVTYLAGQMFPTKPRETLAKALEELIRIRYVALYTIDEQTYFSIRNWQKHQKVDRPGKPKVPAPPAGLFARPSRDPRETLATDLDLDLDLEGRGEDREAGAPEDEPEKPTKPKDRPQDRFAQSFEPVYQREDVQRVFKHFQLVAGLPGAKLSSGDRRVAIIAERLDVHGEPNCVRVLDAALKDPWHNGSKDGRKRMTVEAIFGRDSATPFEELLAKTYEVASRPKRRQLPPEPQPSPNACPMPPDVREALGSLFKPPSYPVRGSAPAEQK